MVVTFGCGHRADVPSNLATAPVCPTCGDRRVTHVKTRPPSFTGACTGPYATFKALDAMPVSLAPQGSLTLKPQQE